MFSKFKEKILNMSNGYLYYKNNYEKLKVLCTNQQKRLEELEKENKELKNFFENIMNSQNDITASLNALNPMFKEELGNVIVNQEKQNKFFDTLMKNDDDISKACRRIEKSSVHSNIKIDSKFNENQRYFDNKIDTLIENVTSKENTSSNNKIDISKKFPEKINSN